MKHNFIRRSLIAILCYASMLTFSTHGAQAAPSLKSQLYTAVSNASANWPKIGSYRILNNNYGRSIPTEIYFYNDQLQFKELVPGYGGATDSQIQIFEPFYSYTPFPTKTANSKLILEKLKVKRIDWTRYTGGYSKNEPNGYVDSITYKKFFTMPLDVLTTSFNNSTNITFNKNTGLWVITGKCATQKCTSYVSFRTDGKIKSLQQNFADGKIYWFTFDTVNPTNPFVDHAYVIDRETGNIAIY